MSKEKSAIDPLLEKYLNMDFLDIKITPKGIEDLKGNPNAPTRQYLGMVRTPEEDKKYREESLKRQLP